MTTSHNRRVDDKLTPRPKPFDEKLTRASLYAPLFSSVRFGPGSIAIIFFIAFLTVELYLSGLAFLAAISAATGIFLVGVKSMEIIQLSHPEARKLIGQRCVVVREVGKGKVGIVKVYGSNGRLDPELWSAESESEIHEGHEATVVGLRTIVLVIKP
jgi:membrane protein implicated in regulation of membrane protease activity